MSESLDRCVRGDLARCFSLVRARTGAMLHYCISDGKIRLAHGTLGFEISVFSAGAWFSTAGRLAVSERFATLTSFEENVASSKAEVECTAFRLCSDGAGASGIAWAWLAPPTKILLLTSAKPNREKADLDIKKLTISTLAETKLTALFLNLQEKSY